MQLALHWIEWNIQPVMNRTVSAAVLLPWLFILPTRACCNYEIYGKNWVGLILTNGNCPPLSCRIASICIITPAAANNILRTFQDIWRQFRKYLTLDSLVYSKWNIPAKHRLTDTKLSGFDRRMIFSISPLLSGEGSEILGTTGKRPRLSSFLR